MSRKIKSKGSKLFSVNVPLFATTVVRIRAASAEDALEQAMEKVSPPSVCHQCSSDIEIGEIDTDSLNIECVAEVDEDQS